MKTTFKRTLSAAAAALVLAAAIPLNVGATSAVTSNVPGYVYPTYTPNATDGTAYFVKALVLDEEANVPKVEFTYTITPATVTVAPITHQVATSGKLQVKSGVAGATVGKASYTSADTVNKKDAAQTSTVIKTNGTSPSYVTDTVVGLTGKNYVRKEVPVDLTGCTFDEPGVYRYEIEEVVPTTKPAGITYDVKDDGTQGTCKRYLDVYVEDYRDTTETDPTKEYKLHITGYVLHTADDTVAADGTNPTGKNTGFTNKFETHDLTISKTISGNQASRDEYFQFVVTINGEEGSVYDIDVTNCDAVTKANGLDSTTHVNKDNSTKQNLSIGTGETSVTASFWLQGRQSVTINGIADGTTYSIVEIGATENPSDTAVVLNNEGYSTSGVITEGSATSDGSFTNNTRTATDSTTGIKADTTVAYTNTKNGTVPTGVLLSYTPAAVVGIIVIAGIIFLVRKRRAE